MFELLLGSAAAFATAFVSAVAGFGGGVLLLPALTAGFGLREAVPLLTVTQLISNAGRLGLNRAHVHWPVVQWYAVGAVPLAVAGGVVFAAAPVAGLQRLLGAILIAMVVWRWLRPHPRRPTERSFIAVGATSGVVSSLVGVAGPITAPFFLAYGLAKASFIGTEAAASLVVQLTKLVTYGSAGLVGSHVVWLGLALAPSTMLGVWAGKHTVELLSERIFARLVELGILATAVVFLIRP